jgi:hypothetical protein
MNIFLCLDLIKKTNYLWHAEIAVVQKMVCLKVAKTMALVAWVDATTK